MTFYADAVQGARAVLSDRKELDPDARAVAEMDPEVRGCWKIETGEATWIVYTSDHLVPVLRGTYERIR